MLSKTAAPWTITHIASTAGICLVPQRHFLGTVVFFTKYGTPDSLYLAVVCMLCFRRIPILLCNKCSGIYFYACPFWSFPLYFWHAAQIERLLNA